MDGSVKSFIGKQIEQKRTLLGFTQAELGRYLKVSRITVLNMEKGKINTSPERLYSVCCALHIQPNELFPSVKFTKFKTKIVHKVVHIKKTVKVKRSAL